MRSIKIIIYVVIIVVIMKLDDKINNVIEISGGEMTEASRNYGKVVKFCEGKGSA